MADGLIEGIVNREPAMKKLFLLIALSASAAFAQDPNATARASAGCGPNHVQFDVKLDETPHALAQPEAGKAVLYVFEDSFSAPTMRIGADGSWVGATNAKSYIYLSLPAGTHNVCTEWQSNAFKKTAEKVGAAASLNLEGGKTYFLRMTFEEIAQASGRIRLELADDAEGQFLLSSSVYSSSRPKK
jgi:hypothetical protein